MNVRQSYDCFRLIEQREADLLISRGHEPRKFIDVNDGYHWDTAIDRVIDRALSDNP